MATGNKVVLVGDAGVGKTSILKKFFGEGILDLKSTIGVDFYTYSRDKNTVIFWDFAGQKMFRNLLLSFVKGAHVIVLVFDLSRPRTLMSLIEFWVPKITDHVDKGVKFILVGNKRDKKILDDETIKTFISKLKNEYSINAEAYLETSALRNENIDKLINKIYELINKVKASK